MKPLRLGTQSYPLLSMNKINQQTLEFADTTKTVPVNLPTISDSSFVSNTTEGSDLSSFLSRPVLIKTITWTENTTITDSVKPWLAYFSNSVISKKLENYSLINCNLKIKIIINSSPFYFGYCMACYRPQTAISPDNINTSGAYYTSQLLYSQQPRIDIYPQTNSGGEMTLPFFCDSDWLELRFADVFDKMGTLIFTTPQALLNANSVSGGNCTIQVYAWAENVTLSAPSLTAILQSGQGEFVEEDGAISKVASNISNLAGKLSEVPVIGGYAKTTEMVASKIGSMAKLFGFSDPPVIKDYEPIKQHPFPGLAVTDIKVPMDRLTLDSRNELTISPQTTGLGDTDELTISYVCGKESLLCTFPWGGTDAIDTVLFQCYVSPALWDYLVGPPDRIYPTPMAHVGQLFRYWKGDIIFRLKIICTQFHRGRLRISWDPQGGNRTTQNTIPAIFTKIVDISETTDIEMRIPYAQAFPWARCRQYSSTEYWKIGQFPSDLKSYFDNGLLSVSVLTIQTSPVANSPISVACFVRGADNLEFGCPSSTGSFSYFVPQSGLSEFTETDSDEQEEVLFSKTNPSPSINMITMGESIPSLRILLRRTGVSRICSIPTAAAGNSKLVYFASYMSRYPLYYGFDVNGINTAVGSTGNAPFNFCYTLAYNVLAPCFAAQRGGSNWTINVISNRSIGLIRAERRDFTKTAALYNYTSTISDTATASTVARQPLTFSSNGTAGMAMTHQNIQAGLQVNIPHYSNKRFIGTSPTYATLGYTYGGVNTESDTTAIEIWLNPCDTARNITSQEAATTVYFNYAAGIDFNLFFFVNVPTLYVQSTVPSPA